MRSSSACEMTSARSPGPPSGFSRTSLSMTTSPTRSKPNASTMLSASLSRTSWPRRSSSTSSDGETATRSLRPPVKTSTVPSSCAGQEDAVAAGRLGQPVDLFLERDDLGPGLLEGGHEPLVVLGQSGQLRLRRREPLLELPDVSGAFGQLAPHQGEFLLQERDLGWRDRGPPSPTVRRAHPRRRYVPRPTSPGARTSWSNTNRSRAGFRASLRHPRHRTLIRTASHAAGRAESVRYGRRSDASAPDGMGGGGGGVGMRTGRRAAGLGRPGPVHRRRAVRAVRPGGLRVRHRRPGLRQGRRRRAAARPPAAAPTCRPTCGST